MTLATDHAPGHFCLHVLVSRAPEDSMAFLGGLLGWTFTPLSMGPSPTWEARVRGVVAVVTALHPSQGDAPGHWRSHVRVANPTQTLSSVSALGGRLLGPWTPIGGLGGLGTCQDPEGALLHFWQPRKWVGATQVQGPGALAWQELATHAPGSGAAFYEGLLDWRPDGPAAGPRQTFTRRGAPVAGLRHMGADEAHIPAHWAVHAEVPSLAEALARAVALGGRQARPEAAVPGQGRAALVVEPSGAPLYLLERASA